MSCIAENTGRFIFFIIGWILISSIAQGVASSGPKLKTIVLGPEDMLSVSAGRELVENQKKLIFSGFPAYSLLDISYLADNKEYIVETRSCSARYDLWEEKIHILSIDGKEQQPAIQASFDDYVSTCLKIDIAARRLKDQRGSLEEEWLARLSLTQLSGDSSQKIRDWLVKQQSGIIKGLFSHMLGDLTLSETSTFHFTIQNKRDEKNIPDKIQRQDKHGKSKS